MDGTITAQGQSSMLLTAGEMLICLKENKMPLFRSYEKEKDWEIVFDFISSEEGLVNHSYFITKCIGKI